MGPDEGFGDIWDIPASVVHEGVWKYQLETWLCPRIILTYHMWGFMEAMWVQMMNLEMVGTFLPVLFMIGVLQCCHDTWLCIRIILTYYMWGLMVAMWVQMMNLEMFGTFLPVLFMIGVWKCCHETWLCPKDHFDISCVWFGGGQSRLQNCSQIIF